MKIPCSLTNTENDQSNDKKRKNNKMKKEKVVQVCAGLANILILTQSKKVYSIKINQDGDKSNKNGLSLIDSKYFNNETVIQICCGHHHSMALTQNGNVYSWGSNYYGQLGSGNQLNHEVPIRINPVCFGDQPIKFIDAGSFYSFASTKNNHLYSWGLNYGMLGLNSENESKPTLVDSKTYNNETIVKIQCGFYHTLLITKKSEDSTNVYSCGFNHHGELGLGHNSNKNTFELIDPKHFANQKIKDVKSGEYFSIALVEENDSNKTKIYAWGNNAYGQLGLGDETNRCVPCEIDSLNFNDEEVVKIGNGAYHSFAITKEQGSNKTKVYAWGCNGSGQLCLGHFEQTKKPTSIDMGNFSSDKNIYTGVNCGSYKHSFAITKTGKLFVWGSNHKGELGLGHCESVIIPQQFFPELFGISMINEKIYNNSSFEDVSVGFA